MNPSIERSESGRRAWGSLSRAQIVEAALRIARTEGMRALTIRRLAADLHASRMSLYRHVADKDALVDLVMDAIAAHEFVPPGLDDKPWPERLRLLAEGIRRELSAYPGLAEIMATRVHHGPGALRTVETTLQIFSEAGLDERQAALYYMVFLDLVLGRTHRELHGDPATLHRNASLDVPVREEYPRLHAVETHLGAVTADQIFDAELDMLIHAIDSAAETN
ncbi:TetR/AcrR family transcriptional regulator C-terminal domain-containing protein [Actinomadura vinacea]|uniref:TetR/AcrR family transcriptional regulator C-terminal domain-containing protein n=1 Tax=Actinomadura vinacea TaxID=115336 RepID=A0ABN3JNL1_9ACTN